MTTSKSQNKPFFSIVIPTYNRENLIFEALESVFNQTYDNYEVIIVENGSTDKTLELLEPLEKKGKIKIIRKDQNVERARARNEGFRAANGDFLTLLDSDDFMYKNNLKDAASFISNNSSIQFFHNYYELVDSNKRVLNNYRFPKLKNQIKRLAMGNFLSCIGVFLSREVYSNFFFSEDDKVLGSEDWELWLRIRSSYKLGVIEKVNSAIRHHAGRSISTYNLNSIIERKSYIIDQVMKIDEVASSFGIFKRDMFAAIYVFAATSSNEASEFNMAKKFLRKAIVIKPELLLDPHFIRVTQIANFKIKKSYLQ